MNVAFIAPSGITHEVCGPQGYQLCLPQPLRDHNVYRAFYTDSPDFVILDNGAAEGEVVTDEELMELAHTIRADEIVIPDVMYDGADTVKRAKQFLDKAEVGYSYMGVVQGRSIGEIALCARELVRLGVNTLGVPRHLIKTLGSEYARMSTVKHISKHYPDISIHCLGSDTSAIMEVASLAATRSVRGIDTSAPVFCGMWGFDIKRDNVAGSSRMPGYFEQYVTDEEMKVVKNNIATYLEWATYSERDGI